MRLHVLKIRVKKYNSPRLDKQSLGKLCDDYRATIRRAWGRSPEGKLEMRFDILKILSEKVQLVGEARR